MKKDKKRIKENLSEALLELVLTAVCFLIGALIISLFGIKLDSLNVDFELIVLIGIVVPVAIFGAVYALVKLFKKKRKDKNDQNK